MRKLNYREWKLSAVWKIMKLNSRYYHIWFVNIAGVVGWLLRNRWVENFTLENDSISMGFGYTSYLLSILCPFQRQFKDSPQQSISPNGQREKITLTALKTNTWLVYIKATQIKCLKLNDNSGQIKLEGWLYTVCIFFVLFLLVHTIFLAILIGKGGGRILLSSWKLSHHFVYLLC